MQCVYEQSATYEGPRVQNIGLDVDHSGLNKFGSRDHNYKLIQSKLNDIIKLLSQPSRCRYAVPVGSVQTYTQRHELSQSLDEKIKVRHNNAGVPHAVAVYGLGGTGKSQLALRYAECHKQHYDPILWIDATDEDTARSSYEKSAEELGIVLGLTNSRESALRDSKAVQAVLRWLRSRGEMDDEWLVVIDNADDVGWGLRDIIPEGERGNIIVTSRDKYVSMLVDRRCGQLEVGAMSIDEATSLLLQLLRWDPDSSPENIVQPCRELVQQLGCLALAVGIAGAYISNEDDQHVALRQYIVDYERHRDELLQSNYLHGLRQTDKTVWTVWDTTLNKLEKDHASLQPTLMLAFLARFKGSIVQDEMFRLASLGISAVNQVLDGEELPSEICKFLQHDGGEWDDFSFRHSRDLLVRYSLVQRVVGEWPGVTMHNLTQWRAMQYEKSRRWEYWYVVFVLAACHHLAQEYESPQFRRHLLEHIPTTADTQQNGDKLGEKAKTLMQTTFSKVYYARYEELSQIHKALTEADGRRVIVLHGLGGVGKTQLAITYTEYHKAEYSDIFWMDAQNEDSVKLSYTKIGRQIIRKHPSASWIIAATAGSNEDDSMKAVKQWLTSPRNARWLMIWENVGPDIVDIWRFLPETHHGSIIITTRMGNVAIGTRIPIHRLEDVRDSLQILSNTSHRTGIEDGEDLLRALRQS